MSACSTLCGFCGMCSAAWEREEAREPFTCIRCGVDCELDNHEPFCSLHCRNNYDGPQDTDAWSGGFASNH